MQNMQDYLHASTPASRFLGNFHFKEMLVCQQSSMVDALQVSCAYCPDFDLCPECFASGAEIGGHKNSHKYYFSNNGNFSIFPKSPITLAILSFFGKNNNTKVSQEFFFRFMIYLFDL